MAHFSAFRALKNGLVDPCARQDSNLRHVASKATALSPELRARVQMVPVGWSRGTTEEVSMSHQLILGRDASHQRHPTPWWALGSGFSLTPPLATGRADFMVGDERVPASEGPRGTTCEPLVSDGYAMPHSLRPGRVRHRGLPRLVRVGYAKQQRRRPAPNGGWHKATTRQRGHHLRLASL
jgi:hypothetical protein